LVFLKTLDYIFALETHSYVFFLEIDKGNELTGYIIMYHLKYLKTFFYKKNMCAEVKKRTLTEVAEIV
jgi:hypothetical protein